MCRARIANELSSASSQSSGGADRRWIALFQQVFLLAAQHQVVVLVVHSYRDRHDPGRALRLQRCDGEARIERVAWIDRLQEFRGLLDERDQRLADHMREGAGASGGEAQHLKAVRQRAGMAALAAIFEVVMDRVVIGRDGLEGRKISLGDSAARDVEALADRKVLEKPAVWKAVAPPVERFAVGHVIPQLSLRA